MFENIPNVKLGLIAVSRDCFPRTLSEMRRANIAKACEGGVYECPVTVENENDMLKAVADVKAAECNALVVFLGNFGPETPETLIAKYFDGPCMFVAAAEGDGDLINGRGDAYCGMLNCSYNLGMRHLKGYIPEYPVGTAADIAKMIADFIPAPSSASKTSRSSPSARVRRTSLPATRQSRDSMNSAWRSRKTPNSTCSSPTRPTRAMRVFPPFVRI